MPPALLKSALIRAARTFVQTFVGVILAAWLAIGNEPKVTGLVDALRDRWDYAAGAAIVAAIIAAGWRAVLDPAPVPSLEDKTTPPPA